MKVCVFHHRLGDTLGAAIRAALPGVTVEVARDTDRDPPGADTVDVLVANTFPAGMLGRCHRLRWLQLTGAGADHVPAGAPAPGLLVTHAGDVPARAVAEFVWMGLLALAKDAPALVRRQAARVWQLPDARLVAGSTLLLVGLGHIGREVARRARAFDVRVVAVTRTGRPSPLADEVRPPAGLPDAARAADHLVVAVPAIPATRRLVDERVVRALPPTAVVVNVARSSVLDAGAVVRALRERRLRAALLDVHDEEPLPPDSPLWGVEGLWVTPHGAFCYPDEARDLAELIVDNLARFRSGAPLRNPVDPSLLRPV